MPKPGARGVFTTGQVARALCVAPRTAVKLIDEGKLPAYRIPGSLDRRVRRADLIAFLGRHDLPVPDWIGVERVNVAFGLSPGEPGGVEPFGVYDSPVRLGAALREADAVGLFVAGDGLGLSLAVSACECCREWHPAARVALVVGPDAGAVPCPAADAVFARPVEWAAVVARLALPGRGK